MAAIQPPPRPAGGPGPRGTPGFNQRVLAERHVAKRQYPREKATGDQRAREPESGEADDVPCQHKDAIVQALADHAQLQGEDRQAAHPDRSKQPHGGQRPAGGPAYFAERAVRRHRDDRGAPASTIIGNCCGSQPELDRRLAAGGLAGEHRDRPGATPAPAPTLADLTVTVTASASAQTAVIGSSQPNVSAAAAPETVLASSPSAASTANTAKPRPNSTIRSGTAQLSDSSHAGSLPGP